MSNDSLTCWYCEKRGFSAQHSVRVILRKQVAFLAGAETAYSQYLEKTVMIPRCAKCAEIHSRRGEGTSIGWYVLGGILLFIDGIMTLTLLNTEGFSNWTVPILMFVIGVGAIGYGIIQKAKNKEKDQELKRKLAEDIVESGIIRKNVRDGINHPEVLAYKSEGFQTQMTGDIH